MRLINIINARNKPTLQLPIWSWLLQSATSLRRVLQSRQSGPHAGPAGKPSSNDLQRNRAVPHGKPQRGRAHATPHGGRLSFTLDLDTAVRVNDVIFIAGGTPPAEDASADLRHVEEAARAIGRAMNGHETPYIETGLETAEMIRYASNAFLAVKITFINEVANLCEKVGANVQEVARAMGVGTSRRCAEGLSWHLLLLTPSQRV